MNKFIVLTIMLFSIGLLSFTNTLDEASTSDNEIISTEEVVVVDVSESKSDTEAYSAYLAVLADQGPKEGIPQTNINQTSKESSKSVELDKAINVESQSTVQNVIPEVVKVQVAEEKPVPKETVAKVNHKPFGALLKKHVDSKGNVNYGGFAADRTEFDKYLESLSANPVHKEWSKNERLAYWINVYNAFTIQLILDNYPVTSIQDIAGGKPWDKLFIKLGDVTYSLNNVENKVIRRRFSEPRIHFAVNCAARSCPPLLNDAFYAESLTGQLRERTTSFLKNTQYNTITSNKLEISKIFDWYGEDFGDIVGFITPYTNVDLRSAKVTFKEYDWALNKK